MKTYLLYQNGKLIMKEKEEYTPCINIRSECIQPVQIKQKNQKLRSLVAPPLTESLKNTNIPHLFNNSSKPIPSPVQIKTKNKKIKVNELQLDLFSQLCKIINIDSSNPIGSEIPFERLQDNNVIRKLYDIQDKLKDAFPSSKLTSLHTNALKKQSFPGVNIVRQIFKAMGYKLRPINTSKGYIGNKKILQRVYHIDKI